MALMCLSTIGMSAQTAKQVLDKCAKVVGTKGGASAAFTMSHPKMGKTSGTIAIKGVKFHATSAEAIVWYDGKTQWTYMKSTEEVNVSTPTKAQQNRINPYNFINLYKSGYKYLMTKKNGLFVIHLTPTGSNPEMYISVNQKTYVPTLVKMKDKSGWNEIHISKFKATPLKDTVFKFNSKDFPNAEVVDLR